MSNSLVNTAGKKLFSRHVEQYKATDPLYEEYTDARGRVKRRKRDLPPGLSPRDIKILRSVNKRAHYLDKGFNICGLRFGWSFIIGIIPGAGDAADAALGYFLVIRKARKAEIPHWLVQRMLLNLAIGTSIGLVPGVGDVLLAVWRANSRNAALLEEYLRQRGHGNISASEDPAAKDSKTSAKGNIATPPKEVEAAGSNAAGSSTVAASGTDAGTPSRNGSGSSRRWMNWRRSSKEKVAPKPVPASSTPSKRDSRFVEDLDSSPPKNSKSLS